MAEPLFVLLLFLHVYNISMGEVHWKLKEPLIFGDKCTLICFINETTTTWMKNDIVIAHSGSSFYPAKYSVSEEDQLHSLLEIIDVTEQDVNVTYTCVSGVYVYSDKLQLTEDNYIYPPTNGSVKEKWIIHEGSPPNVILTFGKIFPLPKCNLTHNGINVESDMKVSAMTRNFLYYNLTINVKAAVDKDICGGNISVVCILALSYSINLDATQNTDCEDSRNGKTTSNIVNLILTIVLSVIFLIVIVVVVVSLKLFKHNLNNNNNKRKNEYEKKKKNITGLFCCGQDTDSLHSSNLSLTSQHGADLQFRGGQPRELDTVSSSIEVNNFLKEIQFIENSMNNSDEITYL